MARYLLMIFSVLLLGSASVMAQTSLQGKVTEEETGEPVLFANVVLEKNGVFITGTQTDFDGNYSITNLDAGTYDVKVSFVGLQTALIKGVVISAGKANKLNVSLVAGGVNLQEVVVTAYEVPLIQQDNTSSGGAVTAEQIQRLPSKDINAIAGNVAGVASTDEGDAITMKGSRSNATDYYIDGIRVRGNLIPQSEIEQMQVITGGIEAQYGDVTGGIISITTKGPSQKFSGGFEIENSNGLDPYGYLLGMANISGPILKNKEGNSILGFRFSGQYIQRKDDDPPAIPVYKVTGEDLDELEQNPITRFGQGLIPAASFYTFDNVETFDFRPNEDNTRYDLTAKLDARISNAVDITFTGTYNFVENYFTPGGWRVFNSDRNPFSNNLRYRGNIRLRHRLGGGGIASSGAANENPNAAKGALIQNASYTLQVGYERNLFDVSDAVHGDNIFDYGYIGRFDYEWVPVIANGEHVDYLQSFQGYTPNFDVNPILARYNLVLGDDISNASQLIAQNGLIEGLYSQVWNLHTNVGTVYNAFQKNDNEVLTFVANSSFELVPGGGSSKGRHNIQFGVWFEQRINRGYTLNPRSLWLIGRQQANRHILGVDTTNVIGDTTIFGFDIPIYGTLTADQADLQFYRSVREVAGLDLDEYVNVDGLTPDQLSLDMFSPFELTNQGVLDYYGYDYLGNRIDGVTFDDFFTAKDENGVRTFPVAAFQPNYFAAYVQDKFTFKDIIFRLGVRMDLFDANTRVLKDPYALYEIMDAEEFHRINDSDMPASIGDDYKVYVESEGSNTVRAYRQNDQWFFPNGTEANDGRLIFGGELVFPKYTEEDNSKRNIQSRDFDPNISFEDYEQQINIMPRLAFSFPISEDANFFAHYDVLVQRPPSNNLFTPLDYFYFQERTGIKNNPNLRPERTVDYEVGFQQRLSQTSAIKIAAYYKEMRDMIQSRTFLFVAAPINQYQTYDNLDFGTVKGFTFQYDLRRSGNVSMQVAYTLQFADGTGSDANSSRGLSNRGVQRVLYPLSFDERHRVNVSMDYRYGRGRRYNGPRIMGADVLSNFGLNLQAIAVSGRPYTATLIPAVLGGAGTVGSINGARRPWQFTLNLRVDKDFYLTDPEAGRPLVFNVYFRVSNVLDTRNIIGVYSASGSPEDDGYLASSRGLDAQLAAQDINLNAYIASYQWRMLNPNNFSLPRRMYVGGIFNF